MYDNHDQLVRGARQNTLILVASLAAAFVLGSMRPAEAQQSENASLIRRISGLSEKLELNTNTSRILTLDKNIPRVQVNNPELLAVTPLSATQVQISAKKAGVTQVNLWDEDGNLCRTSVTYADEMWSRPSGLADLRA